MKSLRTFPSVPAALRTLSRLRKEVKSAQTFKQLKIIERTATQIQKVFKPIREVSNEAGKTRVAAATRLDEELTKIPKAKGTRGQLRGRKPGKTGRGKGGGRGASTGGAKSEPPVKDAPTLAELDVSKREAAQARALGKIPDKVREIYIEQLEADGKDITPTNIIKLHKEAMRAAKRADYAARTDSGGSVKSLAALADSGKRFSVIYADPPWTFEVYSGKGKERSAERHYDTMSIDAIAALPVEALAADDCALLLWSVWPELPGALRIIERWGFTYKTAGFIYVKQNRSGEGIFTGMGYWTRANTEPCLLATRGSPTRLAMDVHQVIFAPVGEHSAKPEEARKRIERLLPGPYLELFARSKSEGWTTWGNEI